MGTLQNFRTAVDELVAGKISTEDEKPDQPDRETKLTQSQESNAAAPGTKKEAPAPSPARLPAQSPSGASILSADLIIEGNIKSAYDIRIDGSIKGNIFCEGSIACGGVVEGDITCEALVLKGASIKGNISAKSDINADPSSIIVGDIKAHSLLSNGKIKGNIYTSGPTILQESAVLMGNINAQSISLDAGATLQGALEIQAARLTDDNFKIMSPRNISGEETKKEKKAQ